MRRRGFAGDQQRDIGVESAREVDEQTGICNFEKEKFTMIPVDMFKALRD
jgi:hypothetical protein